MSEEKLRIMQLIKDGRITPEEGLDLLEALESTEKSVTRRPEETMTITTSTFRPGDEPDGETSGSADSQGTDNDEHSGKKPRWLNIKVIDGSKVVKIRVPIGLAKFAGKFIPNEARKEMKEQGIDFDIDGILNEIEKNGIMELVNIEEEGGKVVKIVTE